MNAYLLAYGLSKCLNFQIWEWEIEYEKTT